MKILIPSSRIEFTGHIQQSLLLAQEQGLSIDDIELGVSPTQSIVIEAEGKPSLSLSSNLLCDDIENDACTFHIQYPNELGSQELDALPTEGNVLVSVKVNDGIYDIWNDGTLKALDISESDAPDLAANIQHLCHIASLLSLDFPIEDCMTLAGGLRNVSRETWPKSFHDFPTPVLENALLDIKVGWSTRSHHVKFPYHADKNLGLYPVVDSAEWIERLLKLGIKTLQLRIKDPQQPDLEQSIARAIELGHQYKANLFINDYWQLAIKHGAFGVHLGQEDIEESDLTLLSESGIHLGLSTHGYYELLRIVQINPSYIALGHIFPTTTKVMPSKPQGLVRLALYQQLIDTIPYGDNVGYPTVAIGGIDLETAPKVWETGVSSLAVVRAITLADDPKQVIQSFDQIMHSSPQLEQTKQAEKMLEGTMLEGSVRV